MELHQEEDEEQQLLLTETSSDLCEVLMERYKKSSAPQHRHLCASAVAMKAILEEESLPFTPPAYFAATISSINEASTSDSVDSDAIAALSSFLSILLPLVPSQSLPSSKSIDAVTVLVSLLDKPQEEVSTATVRSILKSVGILIQFCDMEDWNAVKVPFETILRFSVDKRPKVRRGAQVCVEKVFKSFHSSTGTKEASKVVLTLFKSYMPEEIELGVARVLDGPNSKTLAKPEHLEFVHMLNSLKIVVPYLSKKVSMNVLSYLYKLVTCQFSPLTRHIFDVLEVFFESSRADLIVPEAENIIISLVSYVSAGQKNPMDTVMSASILLRSILGKLHAGSPNLCTRNLPSVFRSIAGLLEVEPYASRAGGILKSLIYKHLNRNTFLASESQVYSDKSIDAAESRAIQSTCEVFESILGTSNGVPNEHTLAVISDLFLNLGELSHYFMEDILLKLADLMMLANIGLTARKHLEECIGSAVVAMGPEKILTLIPLSLHVEKLTCSNIWLVPILKKNVVGASLEYFMDNILPLIEALQGATQKVKKSSSQKDLQTCINGLWDLLPAFCRYPTDTYKFFEPLAKVLIVFLTEDSHKHENIALALQELVNQNRSILGSAQTASGCVKHTTNNTIEEPTKGDRSIPSHYSRKVAMKSIKALESCSVDLLRVLTDLFFNSPSEKRAYLKGAIGCLASIADSTEVKKLFISSLEMFKFINEVGESEKLETVAAKDVEENTRDEEQDESQRCIIMEFASSIVEGADEDLVDTIFEYVRSVLQVTVPVGQSEAYHTLSRIFQEHTWFCASRLEEIMDLLLGLKSHVNVISLRSRFECFHTLLVYILKSDLEERNEKAFLVLNEIILALKDSNEEARKEAYDVLLKISGSLMESSSASSSSSHEQLCSMIMGYLSGAPPSIMSGAVAALSLLMYKNSDICFSVPELIPSILGLLQSKAPEVIKGVLGFVKVLVSCLQSSDLQKLLADIVNGILPWSSVSRNHFRSKVTVIFEIIIRKCGSSSVESLVPDKYKGFFRKVMEQRHGKTHSKEAAESDTVQNPTITSSEGNRKRTHESVDYGTSTERRRENFNKKGRFGRSNTNVPRKSTGFGIGNRKEYKSDISRTHAKGMGFNKSPYSGGKERTGQREVHNKTRTPIRKPVSKSKFHKHNKTVERRANK